jgi:hypothetical protein
MSQEFLDAVQSIVGPSLAQLDFQFEAFIDNVDEGGRSGYAAYYGSKDCKIQIYRSIRSGSVNCMIAPIGAPFVFGPYDHSGKWQYLPRFAIRQGTPLEEIMNDKLPVEFPTRNQQLEWVRNRIETYFPVAHAGVLEIANIDRVLNEKTNELQSDINRVSDVLAVKPIQVGLRTKDGLNIYVDSDGSYHYTFYERGKLSFDQTGSLDDVLYRYCRGIVSRQGANSVGDRAERFQFEYQVLSRFNPDWAKRNVRETAAMLRKGQPQDIALLPDIGEPL